jgi:hypothetical protein
MRKNAEEYGVRGIVKAAPSLHVNGEQNNVTVVSCQNAPSPSFTARHQRKFYSHYLSSNIILFLNFFVFTLSLSSSFFMLVCKEEEEF